MNHKEIMEEFEKHVAWLQRNVPPDDIYMFTEQALLTARFFMHKWSESVNVREILPHEPTTQRHCKNLMSILQAQNENIDGQINLQFRVEGNHEDSD